MWSGVVLEFSGRKEFRPTSGVVGAEDPKTGLDLLIGSLGLSVGLQVVGSGKSDVVFEESSEFSGQGRGELRASIQYDSVVESKLFEDIIEKESSYSHGINSF